jgi:hypothetical protein
MLLLAIVVIGFWIVMRRLRLVEERVAQVPRLQELERRFGSLEDGLLRVQTHFERWEKQATSLEKLPDAIGESLESTLGARIRKLEEHLAEMRQQVEQICLQTLESSPQEMAADPLSDRLIRYLRREGYGSIRVLTDLEAADPLEEHRVPVEARRRGVSYKGSVVLFEGRVREVFLQPSYEAFP